MKTVNFFDIEDADPRDGVRQVEPVHRDAITFFEISNPEERPHTNGAIVGTNLLHENAVNFFEISETNEDSEPETFEPEIKEVETENYPSRVLIVEDDNIVSTMLKHLLERRGYQIDIAADGRQAAELVESETPPALVILDVMLPFVDGFELIRKIKAKTNWEKIPIIMLTAKTREQDIVRALEYGADDYIVKPFQPQELIARVNRFVR